MGVVFGEFLDGKKGERCWLWLGEKEHRWRKISIPSLGFRVIPLMVAPLLAAAAAGVEVEAVGVRF